MQTLNSFPFVSFRDRRNMFALLCPVCKAEGEFGIRPENFSLIECPNKCGALFLQQRRSGFFDKPTLEFISRGKGEK